MPREEKRFEISAVGETRAKYDRENERPPAVPLDPEKVPSRLRLLIPAAERWGISDGMLRIEAFRNAAAADVAALRRLVREHEPALDEWLAGPEAQSRNSSPEYMAFLHMWLAADGC